MNSTKQLINLAGLVLVVAIVVAGIALVALPMYSQSQTIDGQTRTVAQTNVVYETQVAQLSAANDRIDEIDANLAELRREIATAPQLDDVFELINAAAERTDVMIDSVAVADPEDFIARTTVVEEAAATAVAAETDGDGADSGEAGAAEPQAAADGPSLQRQVIITIDVKTEDPEAAARFIDDLGRGPRLLAPIDGTYVGGETLTATVLAFIRTEG
ncbi:hypothetical protein [Microbacterium sp. bgisy189]|uniref:hypothetical protein n=1 Tax=Microbacterium sp. bgisy189 TaxID=3413798 RepID=UPI003EBAC854